MLCVSVVARVDWTIHEEDALLFIEAVLYLTYAESSAGLQKHVNLVQRVSDLAVTQVGTAIEIGGRRFRKHTFIEGTVECLFVTD